MAEAIGVGASIISFVALAGQVLHGCLFVSEFLENVHDAPDDMRHLTAELNTFRCAVLGFQGVLQQFDPSMDIQPAVEHIKVALHSSTSVIDELKSFVEKHQRKNIWKDLRLATRKAKLSKYFDRMGRAKVDMGLAQASASL
jgi:hypothetical protein